MKKTLLLMLAFAACFAGAKADELTVADGTDTNGYVPIYGSYFDTAGTLGQVIYPATDLANLAGAEITQVQFYSATTFPAKLAGCVLQISLKEVDEEIFEYAAGTYSYQPISDMTVCGTYTVAGDETGLTFELTTPFAYSGEKNLAIEVKVITASGWNSIDFYGVNQASTHYTGLSVYSSQKRTQAFLPKATFEYTSEVLDYAARVTPSELDFGKVLVDANATLNVTVQNKGANAFTPTLSGLGAPFSTTWEPVELAAGESVEIPVTFAPTADGSFTGTLTIDCGEAGSFEVALAGTAKVPGAEVIVCDGTATNAYVPVYGMYYDTKDCQVQFIYPAEMLTELAGRKITGVTFYPESTVKINGGKLQLSVKETEQSIFERETAIAKPNEVTEMTVVATIVPSANDTELVFEFDEPVLYNGGNLAFETLVVEKSSYVSGLKYYGENQSTDCAFYYASSSSNGLVQFLPKAQFESTANTPVAESVTLAEALAGEEGDVLIGSDMKVVVSNSNYAIVSDGEGNWLRVLGQNLEQNTYITNMSGFISPEEINPVMTVSSYEPSDAVVEVETSRLDLRTIHRTELTALKPNEVATFVGYYHEGQLCAFSSGSGLHIDMTTENMVGTISADKQQAFTAVVSLKQAWDAPTPTNGPARVAIDDDQAFENIKIDATSASTPTGVDGIKAIDGKEIQGIYNVNGQQVKNAQNGVYIIRYTDGTAAKVRF